MSGASDFLDLMPFSFRAFFGQFRTLTQIQEDAIPVIMEGRDVLLCSATASGKTEAYAAPAAQMVRARNGGSASVVIVSPTRALANDLFRRLEGKMDQVGVSFGRRTGEYKELKGGEFPQIIITTPESLDSTIARRPERLQKTRLIVLDEIHVLDNSPRGDQLRILLKRLDAVCEVRPQKIAASATVDDPAGLAKRYLHEAKVVQVPGARRIHGKEFVGRGKEDLVNHLNELARGGFRKLLVFCNSRNDCENLSNGVRNRSLFREFIFTHHGSLSREQRERTERQFLTSQAAVCFATMTLEMGIDIGSVDYVLLVGPPPDVASLLQRIGRGGRRGDKTRAGYAVENDAESLVFKTMFRSGARGNLLSTSYAFRPSVLIQQAIVKAGADLRVSANDLFGYLPPDLQNEYDRTVLNEILEQAAAKGRFEAPGGGNFVHSEDTEIRYDRGYVHSNISDSLTLDVVDRMTGDIVGAIDVPDSSTIQIGGGSRDIVKISDGRVLTDGSRDEGVAKFKSSGFPGIPFLLARAVVEEVGVSPKTVVKFYHNGNSVLLHGLGAFGGMFLAELLNDAAKTKVVLRISPYLLMLADAPAHLPEMTEKRCLKFVSKFEKKLCRMASPGPFHGDLPHGLRVKSLCQMLGASQLQDYYSELKLVGIDQESLDFPDLATAL